jgi:hypothetical protein
MPRRRRFPECSGSALSGQKAVWTNRGTISFRVYLRTMIPVNEPLWARRSGWVHLTRSCIPVAMLSRRRGFPRKPLWRNVNQKDSGESRHHSSTRMK